MHPFASPLSLLRRALPVLTVGFVALLGACESDPGLVEPGSQDASPEASLAAAQGGRSLSWSFFGADVRGCTGTGFQGQTQSVYPLNARGDRILVGRNGCAPEQYNYLVFDVTGQGVQLVDGIHVPNLGFETAAHSPEGSEVGFGAEGDALVIWDGQAFSTETLDCGGCRVNDIWSTSADDFWAVTSGGEILAWRGGSLTQEASGLGTLWSVAASAGRNPRLVLAVGLGGAWSRDRSGAWSMTLDLSAHPTCGGGSGAAVATPREAWASTTGGCVFRFDGRGWSQVTSPGGSSLFGLAAIAPRQVVVGGQDGVANVGDPFLSVWSSSDAGATWTQVSDPAFTSITQLPNHGTFDLAATHGGRTLFVAGIWETMWIGSMGGGGALRADAPRRPGAPRVDGIVAPQPAESLIEAPTR